MKMTALFTVEVFNEITGQGTVKESGLLYAENMRDAVGQLEAYYGEDNLTTIHFLEIYDISVLTCKPEKLDILKDFINSMYEGDE